MGEANKYPGITLEEAETVADWLGWHEEIVREGNLWIREPVSQYNVNCYINLLLTGMFGEFEEHYEGKTWADCPPAAKDFYDRASRVEVH